MARMIPPRYDSQTINYGEKFLFQRFKKAKNIDDWFVLHSLLVQQHINQRYGEIDIVVLAPKYGIFCLEVKGSHKISIKNGVWQFYGRDGNLQYTKDKSPFHQAHDSMQSIKKYIINELGADYKKLNFGYGAVFPRIEYQNRGTDEQDYMIYDAVKKDTITVAKYVQIMAKNFREKPKRGKETLPDKSQINKIYQLLRGDFEFYQKKSHSIEESREELHRYTDQQLAIFDSYRQNKRLLINGGAGTGKTVIAIETARRCAYNKKKTLLTCFNRNLGIWLKKQFTPEELKFITVGNIHKILIDMLQSDPAIDLDVFIDQAAIKLLELDKEKFEVLIIDEAQDLITDSYLDIFTTLLDGELKNGNWKMFGDFNSQVIYSEKNAENMMRRIKSYIDGDLAKCRLDNNIRNGKDTALNAVSLGAFTQPPFRISSDRNYPVVKDVYKSEDEQIEKIKKIFHNFKSDKIKPESIIILSRNKYENSVISKIESGLPKITQYDQDPYDKNVKYSTIHSYKGLEADHVVLIEIDDLTSKKSNSLFYTGATRAVHSLHILISDIQDRLFTANFFDVVEMYR